MTFHYFEFCNDLRNMVTYTNDSNNATGRNGARPYTSLIALNGTSLSSFSHSPSSQSYEANSDCRERSGSFELAMPRSTFKSVKKHDSVSMIVNIDKMSKNLSKMSNTNDPQPRDGDTDGIKASSANDREKTMSANDEE